MYNCICIVSSSECPAQVTTKESLEFESELLESLLLPLGGVEVLPNVQYSYGKLTHAGPLRVGCSRSLPRATLHQYKVTF